jgi:hypothetical protein
MVEHCFGLSDGTKYMDRIYTTKQVLILYLISGVRKIQEKKYAEGRVSVNIKIRIILSILIWIH